MFAIRDFRRLEEARPELVSEIESALLGAGGSPAGANTPEGLFWAYVDSTSRLDAAAILALLKSFDLDVTYLGTREEE